MTQKPMQKLMQIEEQTTKMTMSSFQFPPKICACAIRFARGVIRALPRRSVLLLPTALRSFSVVVAFIQHLILAGQRTTHPERLCCGRFYSAAQLTNSLRGENNSCVV